MDNLTKRSAEAKKQEQGMKQNTTPGKENGAQRWRPFLRSYDTNELSVLTFQNKEDAYKALDMVWKGSLHGMPFGMPGYDSLVIPTEAIQHFSEAGLTFEESKLLTHDELTAEELNELRKQSIY